MAQARPAALAQKHCSCAIGFEQQELCATTAPLSGAQCHLEVLDGGAGSRFRPTFMSKGAHLQAVTSHNRICLLLNWITGTTQVTFRLIRASHWTKYSTWPVSSSVSINLWTQMPTIPMILAHTGPFGPHFPALSFGGLYPYFLSLSLRLLCPLVYLSFLRWLQPLSKEVQSI